MNSGWPTRARWAKELKSQFRLDAIRDERWFLEKKPAEPLWMKVARPVAHVGSLDELLHPDAGQEGRSGRVVLDRLVHAR